MFVVTLSFSDESGWLGAKGLQTRACRFNLLMFCILELGCFGFWIFVTLQV